jgi:hypothetical protein
MPTPDPSPWDLNQSVFVINQLPVRVADRQSILGFSKSS